MCVCVYHNPLTLFVCVWVQRDKRANSSVVVWYRRCKKRAEEREREREMDRMKNEVNLPVLVSNGGAQPQCKTVCCDVSGRGRDQRSTGNGSFLGGMYFFCFIESKFSLRFPRNYLKMRRRRRPGLIHLMLPSSTFFLSTRYVV